MSGRGPERTCVACRQKAAAADLVRLVRHPVTGAVVVDLAGKLPGRGAWTHATAACVEALRAKPGKLERALGGPLDTSTLRDGLLAATERAVLDGISMAAASGSLVGGHDRLAGELRAGRIRLVVVASDASPRTVSSLQRAASELTTDEEDASYGKRAQALFVRVGVGREDLGARTGRGARAALGVRATRGSAFLRRQLHRLSSLG